MQPATSAAPCATRSSTPPLTRSSSQGLIARPCASSTSAGPAPATASTAPPVPCALGEVFTLGPRLRLRGQPEMEAIGDAIHGFFAVDRPGLTDGDRLALARAILAGHGVIEHLGAADLVAASTRL